MYFSEETVINEEQTQVEYKIKSKHIKIYSTTNLDTVGESIYGTYPAGTYDGPMDFSSNKQYLNNYLFGENSSIFVRSFYSIHQRTNGFAIGTDGSTSCAHISIAIPRNLNITRISCHVDSLSSSRPAIFRFATNYEVSSGNGWLEKPIEKGASGFDFSYPNSESGLINPLREFTMWVNPRIEYNSFKTTTGLVITNLTFYSRNEIVAII